MKAVLSSYNMIAIFFLVTTWATVGVGGLHVRGSRNRRRDSPSNENGIEGRGSLRVLKPGDGKGGFDRETYLVTATVDEDVDIWEDGPFRFYLECRNNSTNVFLEVINDGSSSSSSDDSGNMTIIGDQDGNGVNGDGGVLQEIPVGSSFTVPMGGASANQQITDSNDGAILTSTGFYFAFVGENSPIAHAFSDPNEARLLNNFGGGEINCVWAGEIKFGEF